MVIVIELALKYNAGFLCACLTTLGADGRDWGFFKRLVNPKLVSTRSLLKQGEKA